MNGIGGLGVVLALGAGGLLGLRALAPRLRRLQPGDTVAQGFLLWVVGFLAFHLAGAGLALWLLPRAEGEGPPPISQVMPLQALASLLAAGVMLIVAGRRGVTREELGLRAHRGPSPLAVAVCAWLSFYPLFLVVALANAKLQALFGNELSPQQYLQDFLADEQARSSPLIWAVMVLVLPACEELLFRGALYGGLRRLLHPAAAIGASALLFAFAHGNAVSLLLPVTALGVVLALLYERTGSLTTPVLFHALHNGLTLALAALFPEALESA
ncbi:MAG TPA: type II CAAX endopeptidase family protein [Planctomycetota bacterium]|nr:type II CAAX endopeptidase family protein [Planctomycetota bacterium]